MTNRPHKAFVAIVAAACYSALLVINVHATLPGWVMVLSTFAAVGCVLLMLSCLISVFEQSEASYTREFDHDR